MPYPNEHAARLRSPGDFSKDTFRRTRGGTIYGRIKVPASVGIIWAKLKGKDKPADMPIPQALRFPTKDWGTKGGRAKKWLADRNVKYIRFEPAPVSASESLEGGNKGIRLRKLVLSFNGEELEITPVAKGGQ